LTYEEILRVAKIAVGMGVEKIRITGGEPLVRKGIHDLISRVSALSGLQELCLTTNGIYLAENLDQLQAAGIRRFNVSMDSLRRDKYEQVTGYDGLERVWEGIRTAEAMGLGPIKINVVLLKGVNDDEVLEFARLSLENPYHIRFIEYMPMGPSRYRFPSYHLSNTWVKDQLAQLGGLIQVPQKPHDGPAERFKLHGASGEIGFISPLTNHFCHVCNRLRLTSTGQLRVCLLSDREIDMKGPLRSGVSDHDIVGLFLKAAASKPRAHLLGPDNLVGANGRMSAIGG
jgi:cyclic pyranopterin phosphate synthase